MAESADPADRVLGEALEFARRISRDLVAAHDTIAELRKENSTLHYLMGQSVA
jgi:hypothetical protein